VKREAAVSTNSEQAVHALQPPAARADTRAILRRVLSKSYLFLVLLLIIVVGHIVSPNFLSVRNASNVVAFSSIIALLAVGQFYVILTGGIDLSVGAVLALSTVIAALLLRTDMNTVLASVLTLAACGLVGLCNGLIVV
jgi:ribose transport system permease protein